MGAQDRSFTSAIARMVYAGPSVPNFARVVARMDRELTCFRGRNRRLEWDEDDLAIFDLDCCRIVLAMAESSPVGRGNHGVGACLTVAAGRSPYPAVGDEPPFWPQHLCCALVEKLCEDQPCAIVMWSEKEGTISEAMIDRILSSQLPV